MTSDRVDKLVVQPAAAGAVDQPQRRRTLWLGVATVLLLAAALALFLLDRGQQSARAEELERSVAALARQVTQLGGTPVVQPAGVPGPQGPAGRDGRDGVDGTDGVTPPCVTEPPQCRGESGAPGTPGLNGQPGKDGADGKDGRDGVNGTDGRPPAMWTWTDDAGREQTCMRNADSPDDAPTYTCTAPSTGPPGTTAVPPLLRR